MILNKVALENFVSHKKTEIDLRYGINVIIGPNGAGKTSVLDAISFALFNDYSNRGKKEKLINDRANKCKVNVGFTEGGIRYDAEWSMERGGSAHGSLFRTINGTRNLLVRGGERSVVPEVQKILGFDKNMYMQSVYVRQGEIEKLVTSTPGDRKELISKLLGVEELDAAWNNIKAVIQVYREMQIALQTELNRQSTIENNRREYEAKARELEKALSVKKKAVADLVSELNHLRVSLEKLKSKRKQFEKYDKEKAITEENLRGLEKRLEQEKAELEKAVAAEEVVTKLRDVIVKLPFLDEYVNHLTEKEKQELKKNSLQEKLNGICQLKKTLEETAKNHEAFLEKEKLVVEKSKERRKYEGAETALSNAMQQLEECEKEETSRNANLLKELEKCSKALGEIVTVDNVEQVLERKRKEYQELSQTLNASFVENTGMISVLGQRIKELDDNLSKFSSDIDVKNCPTCETELTPERLKELVKKYSKEKIEAEAKKTKLQAELNEVNNKLGQLQKITKKIDLIDPERIKSLAAEWEDAKNRITLQKGEIKEAEKQAETLRLLDKEIEQLESEKRDLKEAFNEYETSKRQLGKLPSQEEIDNQMKPITVAIAAASRLIEDSLTKLGYTPIDPQKELKELLKKKETYDQKLPIAEKKAEIEANLQKTNTDLSICRDKLSSTVRAIEDLGYDEKKHEEQEKLFDAKLKTKSEFEEEIAGLKQARINAEDETRKCVEELKALEKKGEEKKEVERFIGILNEIRDAYGKDGIQKVIRARARPLLERSTRDLFERFNLSYSDIKIDDDYNISVIGANGLKDIDQISGGERVALAIALRLAIAQVLSGKIETIIMDEPTTHLDEQRRKELVSILSSFFREGGRIIPQMLIITHHSEIEDVADTTYTVRKEEDYSVTEKATLN